MLHALRVCLILAAVRPVAWLLIGAKASGREHLPRCGPAIVAANHNSHIDTLLLLSLFPLQSLHVVRPVAAADRFLGSPILSWFSQYVVRIVPVARGRQRRDVDTLADCRRAMENHEILLIFPEGTRGDAEAMSPLKSGIVHLAQAFPAAPLIPVYIRGAGRVLPPKARGPRFFECSVVIGPPVDTWGTNRAVLGRLRATFAQLHQKSLGVEGVKGCTAA